MDQPGPTSEMTIGDRLRAARKDAGLSQADLAARVGVSQPAVANWESGVHDPRRLMLAKLAEALGVSTAWLGSGARSPVERDRHAAAAYIRRPLQHAPVIALQDAAHLLGETPADPHSLALDYIPVTSGTETIFGVFVDDPAISAAFPKNSLVVIDYADRRPSDGVHCLALVDGAVILRRWREQPGRFETAAADDANNVAPYKDGDQIIGCARVSIRFH